MRLPELSDVATVWLVVSGLALGCVVAGLVVAAHYLGRQDWLRALVVLLAVAWNGLPVLLVREVMREPTP